MAITIDNGEIKKDGKVVLIPRDLTGTGGTSLLVGMGDDEQFRPVKVNASGKLEVDSTVTVGDVNIGEVGIAAMDSASVVGPVHRVQNAGLPITSSLLTVDPRMAFVSTELKTLAYGNNAGSNVALKVDGTGALSVAVSSMPVVTTTSQDSVYAPATLATTDAWVDLISINCRGFMSKTISVKNSGANSADISIYASLDNGVTFDIPITNSYEVVAGATYVFNHSTAVTHIKVRVKSYVAGNQTNVLAKAYAMGA